MSAGNIYIRDADIQIAELQKQLDAANARADRYEKRCEELVGICCQYDVPEEALMQPMDELTRLGQEVGDYD